MITTILFDIDGVLNGEKSYLILLLKSLRDKS